MKNMKDWTDLTIEEKKAVIQDALDKWRRNEQPYRCCRNEYKVAALAQTMYYSQNSYPLKCPPIEVQREPYDIVRTMTP